MMHGPREDALTAEIDWFLLVTGRIPNEIRASTFTLGYWFGDQGVSPRWVPLAIPGMQYERFTGPMMGHPLDLVIDDSVPRWTWQVDQVQAA